MIRSLITEGVLAAGETDIVAGGLNTWAGVQPKGIIVCHGSGVNGTDTWYSVRHIIRRLAQFATVHVGDIGLQTWGSDVVVSRIDEAIDLLASTYATEAPVGILGLSMGGCSALNYAVRHPERVAVVAAAIPLLDLNDARANPWLTARWPEMDAIYGTWPGAAWDEHSPVDFATDLPSDMPIHIWSSSDDGLARRPTHEAFMAARPQTGFTDLGPVGHSLPAAHDTHVVGFLARHMAGV